MGLKVSAGGAVLAVLGGRGAGRALKREFIVFLKENIGFLRSGEFPGGPKTGGWAPSGALDGASGRSPGAVGRVLGARESVRGAPRESADPGWPGRLGVGVGAWRGFKVLGDI